MTAGEKQELAAWLHNRLSWYEPLDDMREQLPYEAQILEWIEEFFT